jgi:hypothetical protein
VEKRKAERKALTPWWTIVDPLNFQRKTRREGFVDWHSNCHSAMDNILLYEIRGTVDLLQCLAFHRLPWLTSDPLCPPKRLKFSFLRFAAIVRIFGEEYYMRPMILPRNTLTYYGAFGAIMLRSTEWFASCFWLWLVLVNVIVQFNPCGWRALPCSWKENNSLCTARWLLCAEAEYVT